MLPALGRQFNVVVIEDDHLQGAGSQQLEDHHVSDPDIVNGGEGGPTLIKGDPTINHPDHDPPCAASVRLEPELRRDGGEVLREIHRQR